jgi:uncharacterized protein
MTGGEGLGWLLDDFVVRVPQVGQAVMLSRDGMLAAASAAVSRENAERLAAIAAAFHSLARGAVQQLEGVQARQVIVEMAAAYLFVSAAGAGSCLAVVSSANADVGLVAYEMALLVKRLPDQLALPPRDM